MLQKLQKVECRKKYEQEGRLREEKNITDVEGSGMQKIQMKKREEITDCGKIRLAKERQKE